MTAVLRWARERTREIGVGVIAGLICSLILYRYPPPWGLQAREDQQPDAPRPVSATIHTSPVRSLAFPAAEKYKTTVGPGTQPHAAGSVVRSPGQTGQDTSGKPLPRDPLNLSIDVGTDWCRDQGTPVRKTRLIEYLESQAVEAEFRGEAP